MSSVFTRTGAVTAQTGDYTVAQVTGAAPLASPALTGTPTAPTQAPNDNSVNIATTAYVDAATGGNDLLSSSVTLSAAQILALNTTPVQLIAAPGVGEMIVPDSVEFHYTNGGINFATSASLLLTWQNYSTLAVWASSNAIPFTAAGGFAGGPNSGFASIQLGTNGPNWVGGNPVSIENQPLFIAASVNPTLGNGSLKVVVRYRIVTF